MSFDPATGSLPDPLPLVGRAGELKRLERLLGDDEAPRVVFVRGEGGVGKSRLAAELESRASERGWTVARGRAYPVESGTPYAIFSDAWLPLITGMDASTLTVLSRGAEAELGLLFPALQLGADGPLERGSGEPDEFRTRLFWTFTEFAKRVAARTPVLCVLEDLQWADDSSLELIHFLARQSSGHPLVVICTYNDQDRNPSSSLAQVERSVVSIDAGAVMVLEPLSGEQVAELVARAFAVDVEPVRAFAAELFAWTKGNPFFVEEIIKSLVASGRLRREGDTWVGWHAQDFDMPASIRDAIVARMQGFPDSARAVAEMAAVVGSRVTSALLEGVTERSAIEILTDLELLCRHGVLEERSDGLEVVYDFRHPLVRQTLYDEFGLQRTRVLHGVVAEALEAHYGSAADQHADELAFHFARSDGTRLRSKATRYLVSAGRRALQRRADAEAINYFQSALDRAMDETEHDAKIQAEVVPLLARAHTHLGHFSEASALWEAARDRLPSDSPWFPGVCRALGMTLLWRGLHDAAMHRFDEGLDASRRLGDDRATVRLLVARAHALHELGRASEALETLAPALPLAEAADNPALEARVHRALTLLHVWVGPPELARRHGARAIELARAIGDLGIEFWARWGLAVLDGMRGDTKAMAGAIDALNDIADRANSPVLRLWTADMSVELLHGRGEWDEGIRQGESAIAMARALRQRTLLPRLLVWTSQFHVARGDLERAAELIEEAVELAGLEDDTQPVDVHRVVPTYIGLAQYLVHLGDNDEAIEAAEKGLAIAEGTGYILWSIHLLLPVLAEACLWADELDRAEQVAARMRAHSEKIDHRIGRAWADACDSLVQWKRGDPAGAVDRMRAAAAELADIPLIWPATRLRRQLAGRLIELGRRDEALAELHEVHAVCVRVGAGLELAKTRAMYRELGGRPPPVRSEGGPLGLTPAELSVARYVAEGLSNKAIAGKLRSKPRTVSTHLSNIYTKLDIGGPGARVRLGNLIREAGALE